MNTMIRRRSAVRWTAALLVATTALAACGGDDDDAGDDTTTTEEVTTTTAFDEAAEEAEVSALLTEFFALAGQGEFAEASALIRTARRRSPGSCTAPTSSRA